MLYLCTVADPWFSRWGRKQQRRVWPFFRKTAWNWEKKSMSFIVSSFVRGDSRYMGKYTKVRFFDDRFVIFTARKRSLRRLCFYRCLSVHMGGVHGFFRGGHAWFFRGGMRVFFSVFSDTMRYGQWAGGTHPTGMHSCWLWFLLIATNCYHFSKLFVEQTSMYFTSSKTRLINKVKNYDHV